MKIIIYKKIGESYRVAYDFVSEANSALSLLIDSFRFYNNHIIVEIRENNLVVLWDKYEEDDYDSLDEVPKLIFKKTNYQNIINQWNQNILHLANYLIVSQDDTGWIHLEEKEFLSQDNLDVIEREKIAKLDYYKR